MTMAPRLSPEMHARIIAELRGRLQSVIERAAREGCDTPVIHMSAERRCGAVGVDEEGHCLRCGLLAPEEDTETECPPGFFDA